MTPLGPTLIQSPAEIISHPFLLNSLHCSERATVSSPTPESSWRILKKRRVKRRIVRMKSLHFTCSLLTLTSKIALGMKGQILHPNCPNQNFARNISITSISQKYLRNVRELCTTLPEMGSDDRVGVYFRKENFVTLVAVVHPHLSVLSTRNRECPHDGKELRRDEICLEYDEVNLCISIMGLQIFLSHPTPSSQQFP